MLDGVLRVVPGSTQCRTPYVHISCMSTSFFQPMHLEHAFGNGYAVPSGGIPMPCHIRGYLKVLGLNMFCDRISFQGAGCWNFAIYSTIYNTNENRPECHCDFFGTQLINRHRSLRSRYSSIARPYSQQFLSLESDHKQSLTCNYLTIAIQQSNLPRIDRILAIQLD